MYLNKLPALLASLLLSTTAQAVPINFTSDPYVETGAGNYGNVLDYGPVEVSAWATTGVPTGSNTDLNSAQVKVWSTGLGSCNRDEGLNCGNPQHQVDNVGDDDLMLFVFDTLVDFDTITIDPYGYYDRDVTFWVGTLTTPVDLTGYDPDDLIDGTSPFGTLHNDLNGNGSYPIDIDLLGLTGNALLIGGKFDYNYQCKKSGGSHHGGGSSSCSDDDDYFKIRSLDVTVVPVPAALWLFGSGLIGLVGIARLKPRS